MTTQLERTPTAFGIDADELISPRSDAEADLLAILEVLRRGIEAGHDGVSFETPMPDGRVLGEAVMDAANSET
jgi:hypothetical protein